jgi:signal transduction histidine kinase
LPSLHNHGKLMEMSSRLKWYVAIVCCVATVVLAGLASRIDASRLHSALPVIAMFGALLTLGEFFPIQIRYPKQTKALVVTSTFAFAMVPVVGTGIAVLAHVATSILADLIYRKPLVKVGFNAAQCGLALGAGGVVYMMVGGTHDITARGLPAFVAGAAVFALLNHVLVGTVVALAEGNSVSAGIFSNLRLELMSTALLMTLAPVVVIVAEHALFLVPALVSPLAAVYLASKGWADAEAAASRQRRLTEQEQEVVRRLQETDRMKADLLATVTHELRSPLTTILGALQLLETRNRKLDPEQRLEFIRMGLRQGERLQRMIEQLLLAARFERPPATSGDASRIEMDASALVRQAGEEAQTRHHERAIMVQTNGALPVHAAQDAVSQVLANLIDNACKYSPQGRPVHLSGTRSNGHAVLAVEDSGPGVAPDDRERIFERFTQLDGSTDDRAGGVGLGLYIARELARSQGGDLLVTDPTGTDGARFELRLPLHGPQPSG